MSGTALYKKPRVVHRAAVTAAAAAAAAAAADADADANGAADAAATAAAEPLLRAPSKVVESAQLRLGVVEILGLGLGLGLG